MKHSGGRIDCGLAYFTASGPGRIAIIDWTMISELYEQILKENVRKSVHELLHLLV